MASFPAEIQLTVDNSTALKNIGQVEKALQKIQNVKLSPFERGQAAKAEAEINKQLDLQFQKYAAIDRIQRQLLANDDSRIKANEKLSRTQQFIQDKISIGRAKKTSAALRGDQNAYPTTIGPEPDFLARNRALEAAAAKTRRIDTATARIAAQKTARLANQNSLTEGLLKLKQAELVADKKLEKIAREKTREVVQEQKEQQELNEILKKRM